MLDFSPTFEFAKQRNRKLLDDTHELGAILASLRECYKNYAEAIHLQENTPKKTQPSSYSVNNNLQSISKYSDSQDDLLHPLPPEMSTELKSDLDHQLVFTKKELSPEPTPSQIKKMAPLPISPLAKSPASPGVKSPVGSSIKSPQSSLAHAQQVFSQSSSSDASSSESEISDLVNPEIIKNAKVEVRKIVENPNEKREILASASSRSSKRVSIDDSVNLMSVELKEEEGNLNFDTYGRRKSRTTPEFLRKSVDLNQQRTEILEAVNATKDLAINGSRASSISRASGLTPPRKSNTESHPSLESSPRKSTENRRSTELSQKSRLSKQSEKQYDSPRMSTNSGGLKLLEITSRSQQNSARSSITKTDQEINQESDKTPVINNERKISEKLNSGQTSTRSSINNKGSKSKEEKRKQVAEILKLSDDDSIEKPWYDAPKTNERKSKLFASSFNALEDDEDSFSYE